MFEDLFEEKKDQQKDTSKTSLFGGLFGAEEKAQPEKKEVVRGKQTMTKSSDPDITSLGGTLKIEKDWQDFERLGGTVTPALQRIKDAGFGAPNPQTQIPQKKEYGFLEEPVKPRLKPRTPKEQKEIISAAGKGMVLTEEGIPIPKSIDREPMTPEEQKELISTAGKEMVFTEDGAAIPKSEVEKYKQGKSEWGKSLVADQDFLAGVKTFAQGLTKLPLALSVALLQASQGGGRGASVTDKDWADRFIKYADTDLNKFIFETREKYGDDVLLSGLPFKITDFAELPKSLAFSTVSMGAGLAVGVPGTIAAPFTGPAAPAVVAGAWTLGTAASGKAAYNMSSYQIMQAYLESVDEEQREKTGRGITIEEEEHYKDLFGADAMEYALWEAVPEAISNLTFAKILTAPLLEMGLRKSVVSRMTVKLGGIYTEEFLTETITQKEQAKIEVGIGFREEEIGWVQAFKEIAPQTFLLTTIMSGAGSAIITIKKAISKSEASLEKEIGKDHPKFEELSEKITEKIVSGRAEIEEKTTPITPTDIKPKEEPITTPTTKITSLGMTEIEVPVAKAVEATATKEGAVSSGFHSDLNNQWTIVYKGEVSESLKVAQ